MVCPPKIVLQQDLLAGLANIVQQPQSYRIGWRRVKMILRQSAAAPTNQADSADSSSDSATMLAIGSVSHRQTWTIPRP